MPELHLEEPAEEVLLVAQVQEMTAAADGRLGPLPAAHSILDGLVVVVHSHTLVEIPETGNLLDTCSADWAQSGSRSLMVIAQQTDKHRSQP